LGAREYDPWLGRFISVDPIIDSMDPQQMNGYAYANNNPPSMTDPDGLKYFVDNGSVAAPSAKHATPRAMKRVEDRIRRYVKPQYDAERARKRAVSRAAQHDWNGADGKRGHVGGYNSRAIRPTKVMHHDPSLLEEAANGLGKAARAVATGVTSARDWMANNAGAIFATVGGIASIVCLFPGPHSVACALAGAAFTLGFLDGGYSCIKGNVDSCVMTGIGLVTFGIAKIAAFAAQQTLWGVRLMLMPMKFVEGEVSLLDIALNWSIPAALPGKFDDEPHPPR
jgi:hypothetical protein